ncbi:cell wall-active antibiotics response protein LiaF [Aquibacillus koreensis]|uniref:Cell wall-active antibiotics response protein LiaF n=1 Tax=Aquibacillus koreensis TaxID=279446 RepID=A0A9X3WNW1_9BACI|nr:cell wall-active antibiotics response protein LiaF [Aquibacillus koreensis]MCT2538215.1 cell wall-active antibiotics response protein LiaF [Aquibacillus koreensis]MDC3420841.1 cell wall-active antibiotics response protein LiaF [Aquibacillus koreensis]
MSKNKMDIVDIFLVVTVILFLFEFIFIAKGLLIFSAIGAALLYFGKQSYYRPRGKAMFWIGVFILALSIMNTLAFKFLLVSIVVFFLYKWYKANKEASYYQPDFEVKEDLQASLHSKKRLFANKWFGRQSTQQRAYEWQDVNIQNAIGDTIIDLTYTVIPKEEAVIIVRSIVGNVRIIVPYDVEVSVNHSVLVGSIEVLDHVIENTWNQVIHLESPDYQSSKQKVKLFTSTLTGKLEVKRG